VWAAADGDQVGLVRTGGEDRAQVVAKLTRINRRFGPPDLESDDIWGAFDQTTDSPKQAGRLGTSLTTALQILEQSEPGNQRVVVLIVHSDDLATVATDLAQTLEQGIGSSFPRVFVVGIGADKTGSSSALTPYVEKNGGGVYLATQAEDAVTLYTQIYERLSPTYYVNTVQIQSGDVVPLMSIAVEQGVDQVLAIIPGNGPALHVDALLSPKGINLISSASEIRHDRTEAFELFGISDRTTPLVGKWLIRLGDAQQARVFLLIQSQQFLRLRTPPEPTMQTQRTVPVGRPIQVETEIRTSNVPFGLRDSSGKQITDIAKTGLAPRAEIVGRVLVNGELSDNGVGFDWKPGDGVYSSPLQPITELGQQRLRVYLSKQEGAAVNLYRDFDVQVQDLPVVTLARADDTPMLRQRQLRLVVAVTAKPTTAYVIQRFDPRLKIAEPDGNQFELPLSGASSDRFVGSFQPRLEGEYRLYATGLVQVQGTGGTSISYVDSDTAVWQVGRSGNLQPTLLDTQFKRSGNAGELTVIVRLALDADSPQVVKVDVTDISDATISPGEVTVAPDDAIRYALRIGAPITSFASDGWATLTFATADSGVGPASLRVPFRASTSSTAQMDVVPLMTAGLIAVALLAWLVARRLRA